MDKAKPEAAPKADAQQAGPAPKSAVEKRLDALEKLALANGWSM